MIRPYFISYLRSVSIARRLCPALFIKRCISSEGSLAPPVSGRGSCEISGSGGEAAASSRGSPYSVSEIGGSNTLSSRTGTESACGSAGNGTGLCRSCAASVFAAASSVLRSMIGGGACGTAERHAHKLPPAMSAAAQSGASRRAQTTEGRGRSTSCARVSSACASIKFRSPRTSSARSNESSARPSHSRAART